MDPEKLSALQIDALGEVGSIGAGHAATALSQLMGTAVTIEVPSVRLIPVAEVPAIFGGPENLVGAVLSRLLGDLGGGLLFIVSRESLLALADVLRSWAPGTSKSLGADEEALVTNAASVLQSAYLSAVGRFAGLSVLPSAPSFAFDMIGAILEVVATELEPGAETAILVTTRFKTADVAVDAALFYLPDLDSLDVILGRLGIA